MRPLSVIIPTLDESDNIAGVIGSIPGVDEVLVIDSFSQDDTALKSYATPPHFSAPPRERRLRYSLSS